VMNPLVPSTPQAEERALSVSELTTLVRGAMESEPKLQGVWVRGETSNVRPTPTGHLFFTLKDEGAQLSCVFFAYARQRSKPLEDGMEVLLLGDITVYEQRGQYQLVVRDLIVRGEGELAARFEKLKRKLADEGLFDEARKKPLPGMPQFVGIVTSLQAAALQDVLKVLRRRAPYLRVKIFPTPVQGDEAVPKIIAALKAADRAKCDVIMLVRGGGSLEDLWCFNDEGLARRIAAMKTPVVTGIGHEVDFTIADFAADHRAPTPSAAAEIIAPDVAMLLQQVSAAKSALYAAAVRRLASLERNLTMLRADRLAGAARRAAANAETTLDNAIESLRRSAGMWLERRETKLEMADTRLSPRRILRQVEENMRMLDDRAVSLVAAGQRVLASREAGLTLASAKLGAVDPQATLRRGFALIWSEEKKLISRAAQAHAGEAITAELADGYVRAEVEGIQKKEETQ
jgi:exodeoxyribonuclease VII large subunit